ncbi:MAG TPA: hypothetical protein ENI23_00840 [bacterium]|nr:hypothetical protein [bacterium]
MVKKRKTLGDIIFMDKEGLGDLLNQAAKLRDGKLPWHSCNICGDPYLETELTDDEEVGYICEGCAKAKKELDEEQEETETMMREEKKSKELP